MTCKNKDDNELQVKYFPQKIQIDSSIVLILGKIEVVELFDNGFFTFLYRNQIGNIELMYSKLDDQ